MSAPILSLVLLVISCFSVATWVGPRFDQAQARRGGGVSGNMLGESRKMFASQFFTRSDIYFHSGYYPSIFDKAKMKENHLASRAGMTEAKPTEPDHHEKENDSDQVGHKGHPEGAGGESAKAEHQHDEHCDHGEEANFLGRPKDPMDAFTRNFFVSTHTHLTEKGSNAPKEILPWIQLAAKLDPKKVESYTVGAYWLRQLNKPGEAEQFLREGLRHNPESYELMLELGRCYFEKPDNDRARNVLEMAMRRWREQENSKTSEQQNRFAVEQIMNYLARVEDRTGHAEQAIRWLEIVKKVSPHPDEIDKRIAEVRAGKPLEAK